MNCKTILKTSAKVLAGMAMLSASAMAAETLFSNRVWNVNETGSVGTLWAFSSDTYSGVTLLTLELGNSGTIQVKKTEQGPVSDSLTAVNSGIFDDVLAEYRRTPSVLAGKLGYVLPMYGMDKRENFMLPAGFYSVRSTDDPVEMRLSVPPAFQKVDSTMTYGIGGFAYDSTENVLWIGRGVAGLRSVSLGSTKTDTANYLLDVSVPSLESVKTISKWEGEKNPAIFGVALHPETGDLWMATSKGVWIRTKSGDLKKGPAALESRRVTGIWIGGKPTHIVAETSEMVDKSVKGALWQLASGASDFSKVNFVDKEGTVQKKDIYDDADYTVSSVAFLGDTAYVAVTAVGSRTSGYFKLSPKGIRAWDTDEDGKSTWLYGYASGATNRDAVITSICSFPLTKDIRGLALSTYGNGISVSADSGKSWTPILNRAKLGGDLGSIRMVPSVMLEAGYESLVSYKVSKKSKVTIEVFSYDMKKVRTIVKDAEREGDASRSTNPREDYWDGYDDHGRACTMGIYYVRVKDNHGHVGWGKVMTMGGRRK